MSQEIRKYYDYPVAREAGVSGAGLVWFLTRDHLSPPYSNRDEVVLNANQWRTGASERVMNLISVMGVKAEDLTLDIGTGIGGSGRDVINTTQCTLVGANLSFNQLLSLRSLSLLADPENPTYMKVVNANAGSLPFRDGTFDNIFSINAFYHITNLDQAISEVYRTLKPGGKFGLDDWFITGRASTRIINNLRFNWSSPQGFHRYTQVKPQILEAFPQLYRDYNDEVYAIQAAQQLRDAVLYMGKLYRSGRAVYRQVIAQKVI